MSKLNKSELEELKKIFLDKEKEIISRNREIDLNIDRGDDTDIVQAKILKNNLEQLSLRDKESLSKIREALSKIDSGKFGMCEECGEFISKPRLKAVPDCKLCISCAEEQEMLLKQYKL